MDDGVSFPAKMLSNFKALLLHEDLKKCWTYKYSVNHGLLMKVAHLGDLSNCIYSKELISSY